MTALTQCLYDYAQNYRLPGFLDRNAIDCAVAEQSRALAVLKRDLSPKQLEVLEEYRNASQSCGELELEAMFRAAFSIAQELLG